MKRIKSVLVLALTLVMVLSCGQMVGATEVEAAGVAVSVYNAQYVPASSLPAKMQETVEEENMQIYIVNDATSIDVKLNSSNVEAIYARVNVNAAGGSSSNEYDRELTKSERINVGQDLKNSNCNEAVVVYIEDTSYSVDGYYMFMTQTLAKQAGLSVQGIRTDNATCPMYRLYNPNSGEHFYTADVPEKNHLVEVGWNYEGVAWTAPAFSGTPVYRLYNPNGGDHHYTLDLNEMYHLIDVGWTYEGVAWYSDEIQTNAIYRLYNPNCTGAGSHHYTTSYEEVQQISKAGWIYEGRAWYGL